jgi:hypothetical protein
MLRPYGLRLKGFEVRGWRFCTFRRFLPPRRRLIPRLSIAAWKSQLLHPDPNTPPVHIERFLEARDGELLAKGHRPARGSTPLHARQ